MDIYLARQPILDEYYNVYAYELLYSDDDTNSLNAKISDNVATSIMLLNSYINFGIDNLVGDEKAFISFDKHLINLGIAELLNKDKVIIEISKTVKAEGSILKKLNKLKGLGYLLVSNDSSVNSIKTGIGAHCEMIKIDILNKNKDEIGLIVKDLKSRGKILIANNVETRDDFEWGQSVGFDYYQGYFFSKPIVKKKKTINQSAVQYIKLMDELNTPVPNFKLLSDIILLDVSLTYKLLKLVNLSERILTEITSIQQAIALLGIRKFEKWLSLAMVQSICKMETVEAVKLAMIRSNLLKEIALNSDQKNEVDELALIGILSIIDTVLEMDMAEVLKSIQLSKDMKDTLLGKQTKYSDAMALCLAYERGNFANIEKSANAINYSLENLSEHYVKSVSWADKIYKELKN